MSKTPAPQVVLTVLLCLGGCADQPDTPDVDAGAELLAIADDALELSKQYHPLVSYMTGTADRHDDWPNISPEALEQRRARQDELLARMVALPRSELSDPSLTILYAQLREDLEARIGTRVCRQELWALSHFGDGAHSIIVDIAPLQPVGTEELRSQALTRWRGIASYILQDTENLRRGVELGYTAYRGVAERAANQAAGFLTLSEEDSPLFDPVRRDDDEAFGAAMREVVTEEINPALQAYVDFVQDEYLDAAREDRALSTQPDGIACWEALYRANTSLQRSAQEVFDLGWEAVERNRAEVIEVGSSAYGTSDFVEIVTRASEDPAEQFASAADMLELLDRTVAEARGAMSGVFPRVPEQELIIEPYPDNISGTGVAATYNRSTADRPAIFKYDATEWPEETRGNAIIMSLHEGYPGHHMQVAYTADLEYPHSIQLLMGSSAYIEGWARYSEALSEELGLMEEALAARILRRAWPARGMVVDAGLHVLGWTPEQVAEYVSESGRFDEQAAQDMLDRIAAMPAQLTSYDSGALEIFALRRQAEAALEDAFDLRQFHATVLDAGMIPMPLLRERVESWIASQSGG